MSKRGYKLQEFVAHSRDVNCLRIGKKSCRLILTGGDDHKINVWSIGKPNSLMSLCGHSSPVESLAFDPSELSVLGGAASGTVKLWDLEEAKMVRTLTGHRSNCTSVEFHPFGEFFASGSADTDLKIWDLRKRRCIFTYMGHDRRVNTIKFSPDGRWVVSGGFDNVVKVWDLTAGKLLHDLKFHNGHIRSIDFHPVEFLLATGSADKTVKFWDLETFEMIESTKAETMGVRAIAFHPDGKTLLSGYDNNLKVYSWEPVICHDAIDMGWSTLGDLCINQGKLIGCSYYRNSIGVWITDVSSAKSHGTSDSSSPQDSDTTEFKDDVEGRQSADKVGPAVKSSSGLCSSSSDTDAKDIKNIYVDYEKPVTSRRTGLLNRAKSLSSSDTMENGKLSSGKQSTPIRTLGKLNDPADDRSCFVTNIAPRESYSGKSSANLRRESLTHARPASTGPIKAANIISKPNSRFDAHVDVVEDKHPTLEKVAEKFQETASPVVPSNLQSGNFLVDHKEARSAKLGNRGTVAHGITRSLVEKFEKRGQFSSSEDPMVGVTPEVIADRIKRSTMKEEPQVSGRETTSVSDANVIEDLMQNHDALLSGLRSRLTELRMVRHFWERNDVKGAVNALRKLSDHSVQADVIGVFMEKMEFVTMDLFSCMLPVLVSLLDSKMERHVKMSLETLFKLVAIFGPIIRSTISAPPCVGVDLHQEERIECCKQCFTQLHQIQGLLPPLARRSGSLAKSALELSLILRDHNL
ncbi:hypothetical protein RND81_06G116000 [Saponaria officinalis]|uniref:Katanin p80 WD40 repeat-containing subunit B1 homolog n=1 Tax=Saponaria officinalis TaxID=3572 RepID=A0AAW1KA44_SAPOF